MNVYVCVWPHIQRHNFATRHVRAHFSVSLNVATWALRNKDIKTSKYRDNSLLNTLVNENERTLHNDTSAHGIEDYRQQLAVIVSSVFVFISHWDYRLLVKTRRVTCSLPWTMLQRKHILMTSHSPVAFYTLTFYVQRNLFIVTSSIHEPLVIVTSHWPIILTLFLWTLSSQWLCQPGTFQPGGSSSLHFSQCITSFSW